jgi:hypothetical protein
MAEGHGEAARQSRVLDGDEHDGMLSRSRGLGKPPTDSPEDPTKNVGRQGRARGASRQDQQFLIVVGQTIQACRTSAKAARSAIEGEVFLVQGRGAETDHSVGDPIPERCALVLADGTVGLSEKFGDAHRAEPVSIDHATNAVAHVLVIVHPTPFEIFGMGGHVNWSHAD